MAIKLQWTGHYVTGARPCASVRYAGPTGHRGSRWIATIRRGKDLTYRASLPFTDGPIEAALAACVKAGVPHWNVDHCASLDAVGDHYIISFSCD